MHSYRPVGLLVAVVAIVAACDFDADRSACNDRSLEPGERVAACTRVIDAGGLDAEDYAAVSRDRGMAYLAAEQYDRAISDFDLAIQIEPEAAAVLSMRGWAYSAKGAHDRAIRDFDEAIRLVPDDGRPYSYRGSAYLEKGAYDQAIADAGEAIRYAPDDPFGYLIRGMAQAELSDYGAAIADFDEVIRRVPNYPQGHLSRGRAQHQMGAYDDAIRDYGSAIQLAPNDLDARFGRGRAYYDQGNFAEALRDFDDVVQREPSSAYLVIWRALAARRTDADYRDALQGSLADLERETWPSAIARFMVGEGSVDTVRRAADDLDPKVAADQACEADFYLGEWAAIEGDRATAVPLIERAERTCPHNFVEYVGAKAALARLR